MEDSNRANKKLKIDLSNLNLAKDNQNIKKENEITEITSIDDKQILNSISAPEKFETEVKGEDYVKIILQFLNENGLHKTFQALSEETGKKNSF